MILARASTEEACQALKELPCISLTFASITGPSTHIGLAEMGVRHVLIEALLVEFVKVG